MIILKVYSVQMCKSLIAKSGSMQLKLAYYAFFTDFHIVLNKYIPPSKLHYFKKGQLIKRAGQSGLITNAVTMCLQYCRKYHRYVCKGATWFTDWSWLTCWSWCGVIQKSSIQLCHLSLAIPLMCYPLPLFSCFWTALSYWKMASFCIPYMQFNAFVNMLYQSTAAKVILGSWWSRLFSSPGFVRGDESFPL